jgi:hypothetical protein
VTRLEDKRLRNMCSDSWKWYSCVIRPSLSVGTSRCRGPQGPGRGLITPLYLVSRYIILTVVSLLVRHASSWLVADFRTTLILLGTSLLLFYGFGCLYRMPLSFMVAEICVGILKSYGIFVLVLF